MSFKRHIPKIVGTLVVVAVSVFMIRVVMNFLDTPSTPSKKGPQQITLIQPPPPPPPPEVKPPEPEVEEEVKIEEVIPEEALPEEASDEPPPAADLGVDAEGGAGGDSFGLIGRKGGRGLLAGAGGDPFVVYASRLQKNIEDMLSEDPEVRRKAYSVVAKIWVDLNGRIERAELAGSTGDSGMDAKLESSLNALPSLAAMPPPDMPQPIRLRISSRM